MLKRNLPLHTGWKQGNTFDGLLRLRKCNDRISGLTRRAAESKALGPTSDAAHQDLIPIYCQRKERRGKNDLNPEPGLAGEEAKNHFD